MYNWKAILFTPHISPHEMLCAGNTLFAPSFYVYCNGFFGMNHYFVDQRSQDEVKALLIRLDQFEQTVNGPLPNAADRLLPGLRLSALLRKGQIEGFQLIFEQCYSIAHFVDFGRADTTGTLITHLTRLLTHIEDYSV